MPDDFNDMSADDTNVYIGSNLIETGPDDDRRRTVSENTDNLGPERDAPIYQISSEKLPHGLYLLVDAVQHQGQLVDSRKMHVQFEFWNEKYDGKVLPLRADPYGDVSDARNALSAAQAEKEPDPAKIAAARDALAAAEASDPADVAVARQAFTARIRGEHQAWRDDRIRADKKLPDNAPVSDAMRNAMAFNYHHQHQKELYAMRSCHADEPGWLPKVVVPENDGGNPQKMAYRAHITRTTHMPSNMDGRAQRDELTAYIEYTAGKAHKPGEFQDPNYRVVYNWVNNKFYLTHHYKSGRFKDSNGDPIKNPFVEIIHTPNSHGCSGKDVTVPLPTEQNVSGIGKLIQKRTNITTRKAYVGSRPG